MRGTDPIKSRWECLRIMMFVAMRSKNFRSLAAINFCISFERPALVRSILRGALKLNKKIIYVCS